MLRTRDSIADVTTTREGAKAGTRRSGRMALAALPALVVLLLSSHSRGANTSFLAEQLRKNADFRVRVDAALKLGTSDDAAGVKPLCACLGDQSEVEAVRVACAAALGKLKKPGGDECLKGNAKDSSGKVREQVATSLKALGGPAPAGNVGGAVKCATPPAPGKAKYYVGVGISNKTSRPDTDIKQLVEQQVICKLQSLGRFKVAPDGETDPKKMTAAVSKEKLDGYFLTVSVEPFKYDGGALKVSMKLTIMSHTRDLKGEIGKSLQMPGVSSPSKPDEDDLIKMAAEKLTNDFAGLKP
jgi:hypothetical protein